MLTQSRHVRVRKNVHIDKTRTLRQRFFLIFSRLFLMSTRLVVFISRTKVTWVGERRRRENDVIVSDSIPASATQHWNIMIPVFSSSVSLCYLLQAFTKSIGGADFVGFSTHLLDSVAIKTWRYIRKKTEPFRTPNKKVERMVVYRILTDVSIEYLTFIELCGNEDNLFRSIGRCKILPRVELQI